MYNQLNRLVSEATSGTTTTYTYGPTGNRVQKKVGSVVTTYIHDADDRLTTETYGSFTLVYQYDNNGNLVREFDEFQALTRYFYDAENRLTKIIYPQGPTCVYTYSASGDRMSTPDSSCTSTTYDGYDFQGGAVTAEYDSAGSRQARYTQGPGVDEPVGVLRGGSYYSYQHDGLGSVTLITDSSQSAAKTYRYDAWGRTTSDVGTLPNSFQFTGRERDTGTGLYYYRARTYDPDTGRFTGKDPAGMVDGTNLYRYAAGNPVNFVDPTGRDPVSSPFPPPTGLTWQERCLLSGGCDAGSMTAAGAAGGGTGSGSGGGGTSRPYDWQRCAGPVALWVVGIVMALAGLYYGAVNMEAVAQRLTGIGWDYDLIGILTGHSNILDVIQLIVDVGWFIIFDVIIPALNWWDAVVTFGEEAAHWTPPGLAVSLVGAGISAAIGYAALAEGGCGI